MFIGKTEELPPTCTRDFRGVQRKVPILFNFYSDLLQLIFNSIAAEGTAKYANPFNTYLNLFSNAMSLLKISSFSPFFCKSEDFIDPFIFSLHFYSSNEVSYFNYLVCGLWTPLRSEAKFDSRIWWSSFFNSIAYMSVLTEHPPGALA